MEEPSKTFSQLSFPKNDMPSNDNKVTSEATIMSDLTTPVTRVEQVNIDGVVNIQMLHAHLATLAKFKSLEQQNSVIDEQYLLRAERRYLLWLKVLNNESFNDNDNVPIPPIEHIDERSKQFWEKNTNQPWVLDPNDTSDFDLVCPWCFTTLMIAANNYVKLMRNPKHVEICSKCKFKLSIESLSAKKFMDDIQKYNDGKKAYIAGTLVSTANGEYNVDKAISDSDYLFNLTSTPWKNLLGMIKESPENCNWTKIVKCIKSQIKDLKSQQLFKNVRIGVTLNVILAYCGTTLPFSIGLVSAVIRQREFTNKMVDNAWINNSAVQAQATVRYHKFLLLQKDANRCFVPTLDIDLCWHTHMLHAPLYRNFTKNHMNRIINHDDTLSKSTLSNGFAETSSAWYKKFNEPYTCEHPKKYWLTTKKMIAAVVLPPYAIYLMYKINKYKKGTVKKNNAQISSAKSSEEINEKE
ncbi:14121_t:CDS:2 [Cetraspora pellucida]|uniref:14121_t:CDS:1 n=1 Tax=Cetraspora pellucida TaxID=1433469 RepID=A0A9N9GNM0_9GLOM|nr:14121_t:CDS:2 [Cetraspora pellucida]